MKQFKLIVLTLFVFASISCEGISQTNAEVVLSRINALNEHNLERFMECHSDDIAVFDYLDSKIGAPGKEHLKLVFEPLFSDEAIHSKVHQTIEIEPHVIVHETVTRRGKTHEYISIYKVSDGQISEIRFIRK